MFWYPIKFSRIKVWFTKIKRNIIKWVYDGISMTQVGLTMQCLSIYGANQVSRKSLNSHDGSLKHGWWDAPFPIETCQWHIHGWASHCCKRFHPWEGTELYCFPYPLWVCGSSANQILSPNQKRKHPRSDSRFDQTSVAFSSGQGLNGFLNGYFRA